MHARLPALLLAASVAFGALALAGCATTASNTVPVAGVVNDNSTLPSEGPEGPGEDVGNLPSEKLSVGTRTLPLHRGNSRPLRTIIWYPEKGLGPFPMVILSHGLSGQPEGFSDVAKTLASAGFVVAAPEYPFTGKHTKAFDRNDIANQPADAAYVMSEVAKLGSAKGDALNGRLAGSHRCAAGFSAGGYTTAGMFGVKRSPGLRCGIVISGDNVPGGLAGAAAPILFIHGDADKVVAYSRGRKAYDNLSWPKAFLTMHDQGHGEFLDAKRPGFPAAMATMLDFLRWNLYADSDALHRLTNDGTDPGVASIEVKITG